MKILSEGWELEKVLPALRADVFLPLDNINDRVSLLALITRMLRAKFVYFNQNIYGLLHFVQISAPPSVSNVCVLIYIFSRPGFTDYFMF